MTNEEAREYIIKHCCPFYPNVDKTKWEQVMGVAIKALEERKTGKWVVLHDEYGDVVEAVCSLCDMNGNHTWRYCPNCGARMEGAEG